MSILDPPTMSDGDLVEWEMSCVDDWVQSIRAPDDVSNLDSRTVCITGSVDTIIVRQTRMGQIRTWAIDCPGGSVRAMIARARIAKDRPRDKVEYYHRDCAKVEPTDSGGTFGYWKKVAG